MSGFPQVGDRHEAPEEVAAPTIADSWPDDPRAQGRTAQWSAGRGRLKEILRLLRRRWFLGLNPQLLSDG